MPVSESREIPANPEPGKLGPPASQLNPPDNSDNPEREVLLKPGDKVGGCVVKRFIAWGGMGEVHEGRHETLDRRVAIKLVRGKYADDDKYHARFLREAKASAKLTDPHIALVFDAGEREGQLFVILEYIEGEDVSQKLERLGKLPEEEALRVTRDVALGLAAAHGMGIIHRDVKPSNIMVNVQGMAKLMDFGLARTNDASDHGHPDAGVVTGTPQYMSPEQWMDEDLDSRADLYSLGVTLYEMLSGKWPIETNTLSELPKKVAARQLTPLREAMPGLDTETYNLVDWMLGPFEVRCASAQQLAGRIDKLIAKRQSATRTHSARISKSIELRLPVKAEAPAHQGPREPYGLWALGGVAVVALCLVLGVWRPWEGEAARTQPAPPAAANLYPPGTRLDRLTIHWAVVGLRKDDPKPAELSQDAVLHEGDAWQVRLRPKQACYLYAVRLDSSGAVTQLFPQGFELADARVEAGQEVSVPAGGAWSSGGPGKTEETVYVAASYRPLDKVRDLLKSLQQQVQRGIKPEAGDLEMLTRALESTGEAAPPDGAEMNLASPPFVPSAFTFRKPGGGEFTQPAQMLVGKAGAAHKLVFQWR
ncbi:MAG: protein kinase [Planctomycetota bacterium]|nr:protein kinase [Planctomycetota bacterium]